MSTLPGFFIVGTDTEVGKTLVSGALILKLRELGKEAVGFKPVVAGTYPGQNSQPLNEDLETLRITSNLQQGQLSLCSYVLDTPAAPHLVAKRKGIRLELETMLRAYNDLQKEKGCVVVEGAGGFLVPLNDQKDLGDFAQEIQLPVILVVGMKLGCINHALLTAEAILQRGLTLKGWVANIGPSPMNLLEENIHTLQQLLPSPLLGVIPSLPTNLSKTPYSREAMELVSRHLALT